MAKCHTSMKLNELSGRKCYSLLKFVAQIDRVEIAESEDRNNAKQQLIRLFQSWVTFIQDLFKEAIEIVFDIVLSHNDHQGSCHSPHLQNLVQNALLHHSSVSQNPQTGQSKIAILKKGAYEMSCFILPDPSLWQSHVASYKGSLLGRCSQITPVFSGDKGIDKMVVELVGVPSSCKMSDYLLGDGPVIHSYHCTPKEKTTFDLRLINFDVLNNLLQLYYSVYGILSGKDPGYFDSLSGRLFETNPFESKFIFMEIFDEIPSDLSRDLYHPYKPRYPDTPGDYLHYLYKSFHKYREDPWIHPVACQNVKSFLMELAPRLCTAISKCVFEYFQAHLWDK